MSAESRVETISVIIPENPFRPKDRSEVERCVCALDVEKLMDWWPGMPHRPHRDSDKVRAIQRSLEWRRVTGIAAYLLQEEITEVPEKLEKYFGQIYQPKKLEPGREWPPRVGRTIGFERSVFPDFASVLVHINGAKLKREKESEVAQLIIDSNDKNLNFTVIDGQHRINGAYFAIKIRQERDKSARMEVPVTVYLDLDRAKEPPRNQAQIFIDVNFYQKKVDRSLVADLFPTARGREPIDDRERAQDIARRLMLETGPLVGMVQIPGVRYGVKDVISLSSLVGSVEDVLPYFYQVALTDLQTQTEFLALALGAWFDATGRRVPPTSKDVGKDNVAYQGRVVGAVLNLVPAILEYIDQRGTGWTSEQSATGMREWCKRILDRAGLLARDAFLGKDEFKTRRYLGSGGTGRFRDLLWAAVDKGFERKKESEEATKVLADAVRRRILRSLAIKGSKNSK